MSDRQGATRPTPLVSVLIPARDAEATLAATLDSLAAQTAPGWEAVVVDDGSSDGTRALAEARAAADPRVRVVATGGLGVSGARNAGLAEARGERVMFLDADDLLEPDALELLGAACDRPGTDLAHGGWARVWSDGTREPDRFGPAQPDNFPALARGCTVAVHACMVRRDLVSAVGGFDTGLEVCEDWDLWQRLARAGAAFRRVDRRVALYRVRADSASSRAEAIMRDGMRVIDTGHAADPRVPGGPEEHRAGRPDAERQSALLTFGAWAAGIALCHGEPAGHLLDGVPPAPAPDLAPVDVAVWLEAALAVGADGRPGAVTATLREHEAEVDALLADIERRGEVPGLARRARRRLEDLALAREPAATGRLGGVWAGAWDVEGPPPDAPADAERVALALTVAGEDAGRLTLPVVDGALDAGVVADALPDHVTWALLCRALDAWVVPGLTTREGPGGPVVARGGVVLDEDPSSPGTLLDRIGWTLFLQEAWGLPGWPRARFYAGAPATPRAIPADAPFVAVELADDPDAVTLRGPAWVELSVGGVPLAVVPVEPPRRARGADALVPALTMATGAELYRAVVREALVGRPLAEKPRSLRARLAAARDLRAAAASAAPAGGEGPRRAPGWGPAVARAARREGATLVLGRRPGPPGSPSWRRAALPAASAGDLRAAAAAAAEPQGVTGEGPVVAVAYAPDAQALPPPPRERPLPPAPADAAGTGSPFGGSTDSLRADFESLFAAGADPWSYESPYETR
ncbi:MAG: glycosyltransferase, partial [Thermoleophilia bacterium]